MTAPKAPALLSAAAVFCLVLADAAARARTAYREGEGWMLCGRDPAPCLARVRERYARDEASWRAQGAAGRVPQEELRQRLELLTLERELALAEDPLKHAVHWFRAAHELFSPPEWRWARLAREREAEAMRLWRAELESRGPRPPRELLE